MLDECRAQGAIITVTGGDHYKIVPPDKTKRIIYTSYTPSDIRALKNIRSDLRKSGFIL